ncbi:MAG: ATP-binding protein [Leptolyngbyaceae cyanobacterium bins.59]|nr:ATP-binding protein [Leptolyngbyaceae cyanobacterium bins.59]
MNKEDAVQFVEQLFEQSGKTLNEFERKILAGAWEGKQYSAIVQETPYSLPYIKHVGKNLWSSLSEVMGQEVNKWNFSHVMGRKLAPLEILGDCLPVLSRFYGREREMADLNRLIDRYHCVVLMGPPGIGKSALTAKLVQALEGNQWDCVIWKSADPLPDLQEWVEDLTRMLRSLLPKKETPQDNTPPTPPEPGTSEGPILNARDPVSTLIRLLQKHRCLIVLDAAESLRNHPDYTSFLRRMIGEVHRSCFLLTSEEPFEFLERWQLGGLSVQTMVLKDLETPAAKELLKSKGLGDEAAWERLIAQYGGNPLLLEMIANGILELFGGRVEEVLAYVTTFFTDAIEEILNRQFRRFGEVEKQVMVSLARAKVPPTFAELLKSLAPTKISSSDLVQTLGYLGRRSLVESVKSADQPTYYRLNSIVRKYTLNQFQDDFALQSLSPSLR